MAALAAASIRDKRRRQATADAHKSTPGGGRRDSYKEAPGGGTGDSNSRIAVGSSRSSVDWQQVRDELRQTEVLARLSERNLMAAQTAAILRGKRRQRAASTTLGSHPSHQISSLPVAGDLRRPMGTLPETAGLTTQPLSDARRASYRRAASSPSVFAFGPVMVNVSQPNTIGLVRSVSRLENYVFSERNGVDPRQGPEQLGQSYQKYLTHWNDECSFSVSDEAKRQNVQSRLNPQIRPGQGIPQDGLGTAFPGRQGPPRGPRQKKIEENHAKYRKHKKAQQMQEQVKSLEGLLPGLNIQETDIEQLDGEDGIYRASSSANVILYVGLGMLAIGLVITFVGLGDKGFKTLELKLIGPSLVGCGVFFCLLRILFCTVPSCCSSCVKCCKKSDDKKALIEQKDDKTASNSGAVNGNGVGNSNGTSFPTESRRRVAPSSSQKNRTHPNFIDETSSEEAKTKNSQKQNFRQKEIRSAHRETESLKQEVFAKEPEGENGPSSSFRSDRQIHTAKPLSYDNYSSSGSSEFSFAATSAEIVKAEGSNLSSMEVPKDSFVNKLANNAHYPDFNTIPQFPNLKGTNQSDESVEAAESGSGSAQKSEEDSVNLADPQLEVLMNPANLQA